MRRASGILFHISSLPGREGIGTFGKEAYKFIDFLAAAGQHYWQVLPLGPTGFGDSPYQALSLFALNPYFIDLEELVEQELLDEKDLDSLPKTDADLVDFELLFQRKIPILRKAFAHRGRLSHAQQAQFETFCKEHGETWLGDYSLFMALKCHFQMKEWALWPEAVRRRKKTALHFCRFRFQHEMGFWKFTQFLADSQWQRVCRYAAEKDVEIIGDIPIYAATDSADAWVQAGKGIFSYDKNLRPISLSGCPPDAFSEEGQFWGTPVYDWEANKKQGYAFWIQRMKRAFTLFDWVRIDHFRGLESFWSIPAGSCTAADGQWVKGPAMDLIRTMEEHLGSMKIIAEDLGFMTEDVKAFLKESGYPGMKVMSFGFETDLSNEHLPCNYKENTVAYTGTHDNDTMAGWLNSAPADQVSFAIDYLKRECPDENFRKEQIEQVLTAFIRCLMKSRANTVIVPLQDCLALPSEARMNTPSTLGGTNWRWRLLENQAAPELAEKLRKLCEEYDRI